MILATKKEVLSFQDFMGPPAKSIQKEIPLTTSIFSFFPPITLKSFIPIQDPFFALFFFGSCLIVGIALLEKIIAGVGATDISNVLSTLFKLAFPAVSIGVLFWFLLSL
jgi:hypothetical protein